ncbi:methyltransferase domain-containing protein [Jatrophihabitans fulvus]
MTITGGSRTRADAAIDDTGVRLADNPDLPVDVELNGQRVWSFNPRRDGRAADGGWEVPWPPPLRRFLEGHARAIVREHVSRTVLAELDVRLGSGTGEIDVRDKDGHPLAITKNGTLSRSFAERDAVADAARVDATQAVITLLNEHTDVDAFLAFGGLLGAVRDGRLIGHDVDLDVGYLSRHTTPVDVVLQSYALERTFRDHGWQTWRFSGADFKVLAPDVPPPGRWIDVFGGFVADGTFYLMPMVSAPADEVRLLPLGEIELEGRRITAPADPPALLAATYGPGWVTPDPSFKFAPPRSTRLRLDAWTRNTIANRRHWLPFYSGRRHATVPAGPSAFARTVAAAEPGRGRLLDIGCGTGRDSVWLAAQGFDVLGLDYAPPAVTIATKAAHAAGVPARFELLNLLDLRQVLALGARIAHESAEPGAAPLHLYGRFLLHALTPAGRANLWLLARTCLRRGGRLHLEFRAAPPDVRAVRYEFGTHPRELLDPAAVVADIEASGGRVDHHEEGYGMAVHRTEDPYVCRMVASWTR